MRPAKLGFTWGLYFLYKGKHTRSFNTCFWRAKEDIRIYLFLLLLEDFLPAVEKDFLLLKEKNSKEEEEGTHMFLQKREHTIEGFEVHRRKLLPLLLLIFVIPTKIRFFFIKRVLDQANTIYEGE